VIKSCTHPEGAKGETERVCWYLLGIWLPDVPVLHWHIAKKRAVDNHGRANFVAAN